MNFGALARRAGMFVARHPVGVGIALVATERFAAPSVCRPGLLRTAVAGAGITLVGVGALVAGARAAGGLADNSASAMLRGNPSHLLRNPFAGGKYDDFSQCVRSKAATPGIHSARAYCGAVFNRSEGRR